MVPTRLRHSWDKEANFLCILNSLHHFDSTANSHSPRRLFVLRIRPGLEVRRYELPLGRYRQFCSIDCRAINLASQLVITNKTKPLSVSKTQIRT